MPEPKRISFTKRAIEAEKPPSSGRKVVWDSRIPKLCLRVTPMGAKTFYYITKVKVDGVYKTEWNKLGRWPNLTAEAARTAAQVIAGQYAKGDNPAEELREDRREWTLEKAWDAYKKNRVRKLKALDKTDEKIARSLEAANVHWRMWYSKWASRRISTISEGMVELLQDTVLEDRSGATTD